MGTTRAPCYIQGVKAGRPIGSYKTAYTKRLNYRKTHCPKGHRYSDKTDETTVYRQDGARVCRICYRERKSRLYRQYLYSLTIEAYSAMVAKQHNRCPICLRVPAADERLAVDHDHQTGAIRGLLCGPCNRALGGFGDDLPRLRRATAYLERSRIRGGGQGSAKRAS
jgi:hypothetical protein